MHPSQSKARIKPGALIVLEGLDATGKSTQARRFSMGVERGMFDHDLVVTHQPSGGSAVGNAVYAVTENGEISSGWARQFLHLAAHAEQYAREIIPAINAGVPVILDRCWWSTLAYGWFSSPEISSTMSFEDFVELVRIPTMYHSPDVVFLFTHPFSEDPHNTPELLRAYQSLAEYFRQEIPLVEVPADTEQNQFFYILMALSDLGLTT